MEAQAEGAAADARPMALIVADCPRCGSKSMTFDVEAQVFRDRRRGWQNLYEIFCVCRACHRPTTFIVGLTSYGARDGFSGRNALVSFDAGLNQFFEVERFVSLRDNASTKPPEHLPGESATPKLRKLRVRGPIMSQDFEPQHRLETYWALHFFRNLVSSLCSFGSLKRWW